MVSYDTHTHTPIPLHPLQISWCMRAISPFSPPPKTPTPAQYANPFKLGYTAPKLRTATGEWLAGDVRFLSALLTMPSRRILSPITTTTQNVAIPAPMSRVVAPRPPQEALAYLLQSTREMKVSLWWKFHATAAARKRKTNPPKGLRIPPIITSLAFKF